MKKRVKTARIISSSGHKKNFNKLLEKVAYRFSQWNVFSDFLQLAALSLSNSADVFHIANDKKTWDEREENYLQIINKYNKQEQEIFPQMFAELTLELEDACKSRYRDVLGEIFHEVV